MESTRGRPQQDQNSDNDTDTGTAHVTPVVRGPDGVQQLERDRHGDVRIRQRAADQVPPAARLDRRAELAQDSHGLAHAARVRAMQQTERSGTRAAWR